MGAMIRRIGRARKDAAHILDRHRWRALASGVAPPPDMDALLRSTIRRSGVARVFTPVTAPHGGDLMGKEASILVRILGDAEGPKKAADETESKFDSSAASEPLT